MSEVIDAHQHFWDLKVFPQEWLGVPAHRPIRRNFLPKDLAPLLRKCGVDRTVFVQTKHDTDENRWVLSLAEETPWVAGVVGWVDLASPACEEQVLEFRRHPKAVGVRHIVQDEPDDDFIIRPAMLRGLKVLEKHGVPFDLLFFVKHLHHAATIARLFPGVPLVIDHLAKPLISEHRVLGWLDDFRAAARFPNVSCKLSSMITQADWKRWTPADLKPYVVAALELFGPDRLMFGSDWPVCLLAGTYAEWIGALREILSTLSKAEQARIFGGTAARFYRLKGDPR